jgi:hypothetical protein
MAVGMHGAWRSRDVAGVSRRARRLRPQEREEAFIRAMAKSSKEPSPKQQAWLQDILERKNESDYIDQVWFKDD